MAMARTVVGKPVPRLDGLDKVRGAARYTADLQMEGMLYGKALRSPYPHARILRVDVSKARALPGVHAVVTAQDIPDLLVGRQLRDEPVLARDKVRFAGEKVVAVAAESLDIAEEALGLIDVDYEELPAVFDALDAMREDAPPIHEDRSRYTVRERRGSDPPPWRYGPTRLPVEPQSNVVAHVVWSKGDLNQGFKEADQIFEHVLTTPRVHQTYLEPHACLVWIDEDDIVQVRAANKVPFMLRLMVSDGTGVPPERINVKAMLVGGDFGGKSGPMDPPLAYFLARDSGRPVKMVMSYAEEFMAGNPRHPITIVHRTGVKRDGTLTASHVKVYQNSGAYSSHSGGSGLPLISDAAGVYRTPNVQIECWAVNTNTVPNGSFRGVGQPQVIFALESHIDMVARELGVDPVEMRLRNVVREGDTSPVGEEWQDIRAAETIQKAAETIEWGKKSRPLTGKGLAISEHHAIGGRTNSTVRLEPDGFLTVLTAVPDQGAGIYLVMRQVVGEVLAVRPDLVNIVQLDTMRAKPDGGVVGGSKVTHTAGMTTTRAAELLKAKLLTFAAEKLGRHERELHFEGGAVVSHEEQLTFQEIGRAAPNEVRTAYFEQFIEEPDVTSFCTQGAEVEVDPETGEVKVLQLVSVHDVGTIINPMSHQGQIDGGVITGLGYALIEEMHLQEGRVISTTFAEHKIPCIWDIPLLKTVLLEEEGGVGPFKAQAIGEHPVSGIAPAIANAVHDAIGVRVTSLPITAEKVYRALHQTPTQ